MVGEGHDFIKFQLLVYLTKTFRDEICGPRDARITPPH